MAGDAAAAPTTPTGGTPTATSPADGPTADAGTATTAANTGNAAPPPADIAALSEPAVTDDNAPAATTPVDNATTATTPAEGPTADTGTATTAASTTTASAAPETTVQLIGQLRPLIAERDPGLPSYDRDHFAGWIDSDGDCVNTRHEILQAEAASF